MSVSDFDPFSVGDRPSSSDTVDPTKAARAVALLLAAATGGAHRPVRVEPFGSLAAKTAGLRPSVARTSRRAPVVSVLIQELVAAEPRSAGKNMESLGRDGSRRARRAPARSSAVLPDATRRRSRAASPSFAACHVTSEEVLSYRH